MTDAYLNSKAQEALKATNGDKKDAAKLLITWAVRDQALLLGLAKPHLKSLVETHISQVSREVKKAPAKTSAHDAIVFPHTKGEKRQPAKVPPPKTSERQASVMHQLVAAFKKK